MKLSEAIRLGAAITEQEYGAFFRQIDDRVVATCALGGAALAAGIPIRCSSEQNIYDKWPIIRRLSTHPLRNIRWSMGIIIAILNDTDRWSREKIADWVEMQEMEMELNAQPDSETEVTFCVGQENS